MKTWNVYGVVTGTKYLGKVQAETEEEAKEKGLNLDIAWVSLCYQCSDPEIHDVEVEESSECQHERIATFREFGETEGTLRCTSCGTPIEVEEE